MPRMGITNVGALCARPVLGAIRHHIWKNDVAPGLVTGRNMRRNGWSDAAVLGTVGCPTALQKRSALMS
jgi:hypothetical protein